MSKYSDCRSLEIIVDLEKHHQSLHKHILKGTITWCSPSQCAPGYWQFQRQRGNLSENRLVLFNGKSAAWTSGDQSSLITKYQQGGKIPAHIRFQTGTTCNHKLIAKFSQPGHKLGGDDEEGGEVTSWAEACCPRPATLHEPGFHILLALAGAAVRRVPVETLESALFPSDMD